MKSVNLRNHLTQLLTALRSRQSALTIHIGINWFSPMEWLEVDGKRFVSKTFGDCILDALRDRAISMSGAGKVTLYLTFYKCRRDPLYVVRRIQGAADFQQRALGIIVNNPTWEEFIVLVLATVESLQASDRSYYRLVDFARENPEVLFVQGRVTMDPMTSTMIVIEKNWACQIPLPQDRMDLQGMGPAFPDNNPTVRLVPGTEPGYSDFVPVDQAQAILHDVSYLFRRGRDPGQQRVAKDVYTKVIIQAAWAYWNAMNDDVDEFEG